VDAHRGSTSSWDYLDFELEISGGGPREYSVAIRSPAGEAQGQMHFPFDEWELKDRLQSLEIALLRSGGTRRRMPSPEEHTVQDFGRSLFESLLVGDVRTRYEMSLSEARRQGKGLRLKLRIQPSELAVLPWEFLYDVDRDRYPCLSSNTPLVRYLDLPQPVEPLIVSPPLRVLGMVTSPLGLDPLDVKHEKRLVEEATRGLSEDGLLELTWLDGQTWRHLQRAMRRGPWHIFHFVGHGGFDAATEEGAIALSDEAGRMHLLRATGLAELLDDHYPLRLVFLNSCEGAKGSESDAFSNTAATLVRRGVPAVVAMQYEITDGAAIEFSRDFYEALADSLPVDAAVTEARAAVSMDSMLEWGTPVLYMRSPDGRLFDVSSPRADQIPKDRQEADPRSRYREGVESAWADGKLQSNDVQQLRHLANDELKLDRNIAADIEREVMGDTKETILERQNEATRREQRDRRLEESYSRARRLHQDREWQAVIDLFERIHAEDPNYPDPEGLLSSSRDALKLKRRVANLYDQGQRHIRAEELQQALECFEAVDQLEPGFRDTEEILSRLRRALAPPPRVEVPDLAGRSISQARSILANEGLELSVYEEVPSDTIPEGEVIEQNPEPETDLEAGSFVSITVSSGPQEVIATAPPGGRAREDTNRPERAPPPLPASTGSRWTLLLRGLALGVFGLLLLIGIEPDTGRFLLYGALLLVADGVFAIIDARTSVGRRGLLLLQGRIGVLVGLLLLLIWLLVYTQIVPPDVNTYVGAKIEGWHFGRRFVGAWAIFIGVIRTIAAVQLRWETKNSLLMGTGGGLLVIMGSLLLWLQISESTGRLWGSLALASGITIFAVALRVRNG
jgi:tetratricopeptide (TPR) repeat protein